MADAIALTWPDGRPLTGRSPSAYRKFLARLEELGATLTEPYWLGTSKRHRVQCSKGHDCSPPPDSVIGGAGVCAICAGIDPATSEAKFRALIEAVGGTVTGKYVNAATPTTVRCAAGHEFARRPDSVSADRGFCRSCSGKSSGVAEAKFRARVEELGGIVVGEYVNNRTPVAVRCRAGHDGAPRPYSVLSGDGICMPCAGMTFDVLYVVTGPRALKFGISSGNPQRRLRDHKRDGYDTVARLFEDLEGTTARDLERELIALLKAAGVPPVRGREYYPIEALETVLRIVDDRLG